jgi:amidase
MITGRVQMDEASAGAATAGLLTRPALELAAMVRSGEVRARELVEAALRQIEARRDLNAFTLVTADEALAAAERIQPGDPRPFAGVPIAIKELNAVAGQPQTMGSNLFGGYRAPVDACVVRRLRDAGFVLVGRTSAPEFGIVPVTEPQRFGATRNPWDTSRTPGGSSGGAAAAVAGGILPVAHGSDGAGSIRIPAACCGLVGLKPSRGRVSAGPELGDSFLSTSGALTRYVADSAAMLDVMAGYEPGDATWAPPPDEPFAVQAARPPQRLRIALTTVSPLGTPVDAVCAQAALDAAQVLRDLGHEVEEVTPPDWPKPELIPVFTVLWAAGFAATTRWGEAIARRPATPEDVEAVTWMFYQQGVTQRAADYVGAMTQLQGFSRRLVAFLRQYDALLTPALAQRPLPVGYLDTNGADPQAEFMKAAVFTPFTPVFNMTGQPAISIPLFQGADGLPLAVQVVGRPLAEGALLSLAAQLEAAHPWAGRMPR